MNPETKGFTDSTIQELSNSESIKDNQSSLSKLSDSQIINEESCFELPDETLIEIDKSRRFQWGEAVIDPSILNKQSGYFLPDLLNYVDCFKNHSNFFMDHKQKLRSLNEYLFESIALCDNDFYQMFNGNVLVSGGVSNTKGLFQKFKNVKFIIL